MERPNKAIYLEADGTHSIRTITEPYIPSGAQSLIEVKYSAINPADTRHAFMGMSEYVAGYEFGGRVLSCGPASPFKPGQTVFGFSIPYPKRPYHLGAHQDYCLAEPFLTRICPDDLPLLTAVTLPAAFQTSFDALFNVLGFGLPPAGLDGDNAKDVPILIWGGSSNLGQAAIRLAKAAGFSPILTTASPRNHDALRALGATHCFDYRDANVVDRIQKAMKSLPGNKKLSVAYDSVTAGLGVFEGLSEEEYQAVQSRYDQSSAGLARQCCDPSLSDSELRLSAVLPVDRDPNWRFCLTFRSIDTMDHAGIYDDTGLDDEQKRKEQEQTVKWGERTERGMEWILANHEKYWLNPSIKVVKGAEEGVKALEDVWKGRISGQKVVIEHPL